MNVSTTIWLSPFPLTTQQLVYLDERPTFQLEEKQKNSVYLNNLESISCLIEVENSLQYD